MKRISVILLVALSSTVVFAGDWNKEDKYSNHRASDNYGSTYRTPSSTSDSYKSTYRTSPSSTRDDSYYKTDRNGSVSDRHQINNNGLIINRD